MISLGPVAALYSRQTVRPICDPDGRMFDFIQFLENLFVLQFCSLPSGIYNI